jgi:uncharacterized protein (TIGR02284 family)
MSAGTSSLATFLNSLIETCKDGQEGFLAAAEDVRTPELQILLHELSIERGKFALELQDLVATLGERPQSDGSVAGALHRGWIDLQAALGRDDEFAVLEECERGEEFAVAKYRDAVEAAGLPEDLRAILRRHYAAVQVSRDRLDVLRERAA